MNDEIVNAFVRGEIELSPRRPRRPRPPILGTPPPPVAERPKCPGCNKPLRPFLISVYEPEVEGGYQLHVEARRWEGRYHGCGAFCGINCAARYANAIVREKRAGRLKLVKV